MSAIIGEIRMFSGPYAPRGWALCDGQLLSISNHTALFSLLGDTYGGDGRTTFALPDLRGRAPLHYGMDRSGHGYPIGLQSGAEEVTLTQAQIPHHVHSIAASSANASSLNPSERYLGDADTETYKPTVSGELLASQAIGDAGESQPHSNMQPYQCVNFIIALTGVYPARN